MSSCDNADNVINIKDHLSTSKRILMYALAFCGTAMEYYNYMLFIYLMHYWSAALGSTSYHQYLNGSIIVLITSLCRPFAAHIIGMISDIMGRRTALFGCATISALSCIAMSYLPLLPTHNRVAVVAFLFICRLSQIIGAAGSLNNSPIFLMEHDEDSKGFISGFMWSGSIFGMLLAAIAETFANTNTWQVFFRIGGVAWIIGFFIMFILKEGSGYKKQTTSSQHHKSFMVKNIATICIAAGISGSFYYFTTYIPILWRDELMYNHEYCQLNMASRLFQLDIVLRYCRIYILSIYILSIFMSGWLSDHNKEDEDGGIAAPERYHIIIRTCIFLLIAGIIAFGAVIYGYTPLNGVILWWLLIIQYVISEFSFKKSMLLSAIYMLIICVLHILSIVYHLDISVCIYGVAMLVLGGYVGPSHRLLYEMYPSEYRSRNISSCYSIGTAVFGGLCNPVCMMSNKISPAMPCLFCIVSVIMFIIGLSLNIYDTRRDREQFAESRSIQSVHSQ
jgi:MFS family permease